MRGKLQGAVLILVAAASAAPARAEANLYEWISAAKLVVAARAERLDGRFVEIRVLKVLRGSSPGEVLWVDRREANRERLSGERALDLKFGRTYLVLLNPSGDSRRERADRNFVLARGVEGVRDLPEEGSAAVLDAVARMVRLQDSAPAFLSWSDFGHMLSDPNPILVETALDLFLKFRQGTPDLLPAVRRLLDHPRVPVRSSACALIATILERSGRGIDDAAGVVDDLAARARRDPDAQVRTAATGALGRVPGDGVVPLLQEIAREDPEQTVRYAAERLLYERRQAGTSGSVEGRPDPGRL